VTLIKQRGRSLVASRERRRVDGFQLSQQDNNAVMFRRDSIFSGVFDRKWRARGGATPS
jgi:hypothetical protein